MAAGSQLRAGERQRPSWIPPCYDERWIVAHSSIDCFRGDDDYDEKNFCDDNDNDDRDKLRYDDFRFHRFGEASLL